jgi:hypothetical protein
MMLCPSRLVVWAMAVCHSMLTIRGSTECTSNAPLSLPVVNYTYRAPGDYKTCNQTHKQSAENYQIEIGVPLLQRAMPINVTSLDTRGVNSLMEKLRCHDEIHILILGGSFTKGAGVFRGGARTALRWAGRLETWLKAAFPLSKIHVHNEAQGSTTSFYAIHRLRQISQLMDLIIMEYALNDDAKTKQEAHKLAHITESIIRYVYQAHNYTALLYLSVNVLTRLEANPERVHQQVCDAYGVPLLSYRRAIAEEFEACKHRNSSAPYLHSEAYCSPSHRGKQPNNNFVFKLWDGDSHPMEATHRVVAQTVGYYITQLVTLYNSSSSSEGSSSSSVSLLGLEVAFPERPLYALHKHQMDSQLLSEGACDNPMTHLSSLDSDEDSNVTSLQEAFKPAYTEGWSFRTDKPGKPYGWIAESNPRNTGLLSVQAKNHMSFIMLLVGGSVSITYLSTYENSGIFEVYVGIRDYSANGGIQSAGGLPPGTLCKYFSTCLLLTASCLLAAACCFLASLLTHCHDFYKLCLN